VKKLTSIAKNNTSEFGLSYCIVWIITKNEIFELFKAIFYGDISVDKKVCLEKE